MQSLPGALQPLALYNQFIVWKKVWNAGRGKWDKKAVNPQNGWTHSPTDPQIWMDARTAFEEAKRLDLYVGFVFTEQDPFFFLDIDNALTNGAWSVQATALCKRLHGAAVEVSQSGTGLHIIGTGQCPEHSCKNEPLDLEFYTQDRFVALTGINAVGNAGHECTGALTGLVPELFPPSVASKADWTSEPVPEWSGPEDDAELIEKMLASGGGAGATFGGKATFRDLWEANEDVLATNYPDTGTRTYNESQADAALCQHLAFWTGKNCERMERLFNESALVRDKWADREDYRVRTILRAVGLCTDVYGNRPVAPVPLASVPSSELTAADPVIREGLQYLGLTQQLELFKGCIYVREMHSVFTPDGHLLKPEQFKATYGGYQFALDSLNDKITKNAWEAFTESQAIRFPKVHGVCFRPELPAGTIITNEGMTYVNTYVPIQTERREGDPAPFLDLVARMLPIKRDQDIILSYMAACVQYPGVKFQWCPLLQGMEGNGKTTLITCLAKAVGERYTHLPNAQDLGNVFNVWILGKLFIGVEEVYVSDRRDALDALKQMITNERLDVQGKGANQKTGDNRANFLMGTNHKDAILKTRTDRRYCPLYTAQQEIEDLVASGMTGSYFPRLNRWLKSGGYAIVTHHLATRAIPDELNPAKDCIRAPESSSTNEAIALSAGGVEQEVLEAIEEGLPGFCGGWVSSMALDRFLENRRSGRRVPVNKRKDVLKALGYIPHPHLNRGRVNSVIPSEGGKPRLYVRAKSVMCDITRGHDIIAAYEQAQVDRSAAQIFETIDRAVNND